MPLANDFARIRTNQLFQILNAHRVLFYTLASIISVSAVITNALKNYSNFYSVAIYLSKSSRSVLILANFGVLVALLGGHIVQRIFFGSLRPNEVERLYDRLWFFITESLLAFTIFRDDFDTSFALMFGFLLFVKSFHWLASDRIEWMDQQQYPGPPILFHFRMSLLFLILSTTDFLMFLFAAEHTISVEVDGMVLFASEYAILMASVMNTMLKYLLSAYDLRRAGRRGGENAPPWENKSVWVFYIELATDFTKLTIYLVFFIVIIASYGLPLNIVRDVYITARSFITRLRALHRYQTATRNMDQRYPNATEEELTAMSDRTCIICREEMTLSNPDVPQQPDGPNTTPKKLPCGHVFHFYCLRSWLERQQSCPTCRRNVLDVTGTPAQQPRAGVQPPNIGGAGPAQPQPGAVPLQNGNAGNNPLQGFFAGRLFNNVAFPPRQGDAAPNAVAHPNQPVIRQDAAPGQQPGIYINYQVQYQFPRNADAAHGGNLAPLPPYPGFQGPGGEWQPWLRPGQPPVTERTEAPPQAPTPTTQVQESEQGQSTTTAVNYNGSTSPNTDDEDEDYDVPSETNAMSPREAARLAALSRLGQKPPGTPSAEAKPSSATLKPEEPATPTPPTLSTSTDKPTPTPTIVPTLASEPSSHVPLLIPIQPSYLRSPLEQPLPSFLPNGYGLNSSRAPTSQSTDSQNQSYMPNVPLSQLPANLTPEQLTRLDTLTRESIDERLRVLEGVSGTVYRCIDELMMLRSALPASTSSARISSQVAPLQTSGASSSRQEEKRRQVDVPAQDVGNS